MNNDLITAAEAALAELKRLHHAQSCQGQAHCPTAAAIASLEVEIEIAKAKLAGDQDPEFQAISTDKFDVREHIPKMVNPPPATITMDPHDVADADVNLRQAKLTAKFQLEIQTERLRARLEAMQRALDTMLTLAQNIREREVQAMADANWSSLYIRTASANWNELNRVHREALASEATAPSDPTDAPETYSALAKTVADIVRENLKRNPQLAEHVGKELSIEEFALAIVIQYQARTAMSIGVT